MVRQWVFQFFSTHGRATEQNNVFTGYIIDGGIFEANRFYICTGGFDRTASISLAIASVLPVPLQYAISTMIKSSLCYDERF